MTQLQIEDKRGKNSTLRVDITDDGFRLTQYGNEVIDASTINKDGLIVVRTNRLKDVSDKFAHSDSCKIYKVREY